MSIPFSMTAYLQWQPTDFYQLTELVKKVSLEIVQGGGIVRGIHNHGIRDLVRFYVHFGLSVSHAWFVRPTHLALLPTQPHRFRAKYPDKAGNRYFRKGRFLSCYFDCNPYTLRLVDQTLAMNEDVLRRTHLRARSKMDYVNIKKKKYNPYLQRVAEEMELEQQAAANGSL